MNDVKLHAKLARTAPRPSSVAPYMAALKAYLVAEKAAGRAHLSQRAMNGSARSI